MSVRLRDFRVDDTDAVNRIALAAFDEYRSVYADWPAFSKNIGSMATLARHGELIVAEADGSIAGAVVYVGPGKSRGPFFDPEWSIIRMLVVDPASRGLGLGRALTHECVRRAERDGSSYVAVHTTSIMRVALAMYLRLGFNFVRETPPIFGVPYGVYIKQLSAQQCVQAATRETRAP